MTDAELLHNLLNRADLIGRDIYGGAFLLMHVDRDVFAELCNYGADTEDMEPDADDEPEPLEDDGDAELDAA
jgi:hypothetical protein